MFFCFHWYKSLSLRIPILLCLIHRNCWRASSCGYSFSAFWKGRPLVRIYADCTSPWHWIGLRIQRHWNLEHAYFDSAPQEYCPSAWDCQQPCLGRSQRVHEQKRSEFDWSSLLTSKEWHPYWSNDSYQRGAESTMFLPLCPCRNWTKSVEELKSQTARIVSQRHENLWYPSAVQRIRQHQNGPCTL